MEVFSFRMWMGRPGSMIYGLNYFSRSTLLSLVVVFLLSDVKFGSRSLRTMKKKILVSTYMEKQILHVHCRGKVLNH